MGLEDMTTGQLAELWQSAKKAIKKFEQYVEAEQELIKDIDAILQKRMAEDGVNAIATPYGTVHTVGRSSARVMDPQATIDWLNKTNQWQDAVVLRINSSWARTYEEEKAEKIPGVEIFTFRTLSITAPKPKKD